jgi:hypothetical protein
VEFDSLVATRALFEVHRQDDWYILLEIYTRYQQPAAQALLAGQEAVVYAAFDCELG